VNHFPYQLTGPIADKALGLIVLKADETIEQDFRRLFLPSETLLYTSRVPSGDTLTPDTIGEMKRHLSQAASLFPSSAQFDAIGYACTSGTALIGADKVKELVSATVQATHLSDPLSAAVAALNALGARRIGIVSPYVPSVAEPIRAAFAGAGFDVVETLTFGEEIEANVARIDPVSIRAAAQDLARRGNLDAIFLSCTNLRTLDIIDALEKELGVAVVSSNQALAWHMARLAGTKPAPNPPGALFAI